MKNNGSAVSTIFVPHNHSHTSKNKSNSRNRFRNKINEIKSEALSTGRFRAVVHLACHIIVSITDFLSRLWYIFSVAKYSFSQWEKSDISWKSLIRAHQEPLNWVWDSNHTIFKKINMIFRMHSSRIFEQNILLSCFGTLSHLKENNKPNWVTCENILDQNPLFLHNNNT